MSFKYLGILLSAMYDDWMDKLQKSRKIWARLPRILGREDAYTRMSGRFYLTIVQTVLLFSADNWVMTPRNGRLMGDL